jgi:hypothetical protein
MASEKLQAGSAMPKVSIPRVGGGVLKGLTFIQDKQYPIRGTLA